MLAKGGKQQDLWVRFDTRRTFAGYMDIEVMEALPSDAAILAAMTAWVTHPVDFERLLKAFSFLSSEMETLKKKHSAFHQRMLEGDHVPFEEWLEGTRSLLSLHTTYKAIEPLQYVILLLKYYKPEVADYSPQQLQNLIEKTCNYINDFLESLRKLQSFLEYGIPEGRLRPVVENPQRDVKAAILHDVDGLNFPEIGKKLGIPPPPDYEIKRDYQTVSDAVKRGRNILKRAFPTEGWQKRAEAMRAEKAWWRSLSPEERKKEEDIEGTALSLGIPFEEARRQVERRRS